MLRKQFRISTIQLRDIIQIRSHKIEDKKEERRIEKSASYNIIMPYNLYTSKVLEDVEILMTQTNFKNKNKKKINPNVEIIIKYYSKVIKLLTM